MGINSKLEAHPFNHLLRFPSVFFALCNFSLNSFFKKSCTHAKHRTKGPQKEQGNSILATSRQGQTSNNKNSTTAKKPPPPPITQDHRCRGHPHNLKRVQKTWKDQCEYNERNESDDCHASGEESCYNDQACREVEE